jgi:hypothetical protein
VVDLAIVVDEEEVLQEAEDSEIEVDEADLGTEEDVVGSHEEDREEDLATEVDVVGSHEVEHEVVIEEDVVASAVVDGDRIDQMIRNEKERFWRSLALQRMGTMLTFEHLFV